jgi:hypothetical protein
VRPLLTLLLVALTAGLAAPAAASAEVAPDWAGVNAQWLFPAYPQSGGTWDANVDAMAAAGVRLVRLDAEWRRVEPVAPDGAGHHYTWGFYDAVVATLARRGIRWYPIIDYSAPWSGQAAGEWRSPPASVAGYAGYAAALVHRYGRGGTFWAAHPELPAVPVAQWEVWNEENGAYFWPGGPDPARYADLYAAAKDAIDAIDPTATVVVGGLINHDAGRFLTAMFAARPALAVDAVGLHAYADTVAGVLAWVRAARAALTAAGRAPVPIEVTEVGWTTAGTPAAQTDDARAALMRELLPALADVPGLSRLIVHTWVSRETWTTKPEDWYGLFHADATPTAAGRAFVTALRALTGLPDPAPAPASLVPVARVLPAAAAPDAGPAAVGVRPAAAVAPAPGRVAKAARPRTGKATRRAPRPCGARAARCVARRCSRPAGGTCRAARRARSRPPRSSASRS